MQPADTDAETEVREFSTWIDDVLRNDDRDRLSRWHALAPHAQRAHPTDEHFLPLPFAFGAAGPAPRVERYDLGVDSGVLTMDAYAFWPRQWTQARHRLGSSQ
jgi:4,5-DOPA dioxygenase extradiol